MSTQGKMLIVDDELSVRDSLGKWFREEGYEVSSAESASEALTMLAALKPDVALLDIKMRGTDGIELQRRIHEIDPQIIVIMMTGYASGNRRGRFEERRLRLRNQAARSRRDRAPGKKSPGA